MCLNCSFLVCLNCSLLVHVSKVLFVGAVSKLLLSGAVYIYPFLANSLVLPMPLSFYLPSTQNIEDVRMSRADSVCLASISISWMM